MKNKNLRRLLTKRIRNYDEWEFSKWLFFNPLLMGPLCIEPAGWRLKLVGKWTGRVKVIDMNKKKTRRIKELIISSGAMKQAAVIQPAEEPDKGIV